MIFTLKERLNFELSAVLNLNYSVQLDEADSAQTVAPFAQNFCPWWVPSERFMSRGRFEPGISAMASVGILTAT